MNLKASKRGLKKEKYVSKYVHCCVIGCHGNSLHVLHLVVSFKGRDKVFWNIYISQIMHSATVKCHI